MGRKRRGVFITVLSLYNASVLVMHGSLKPGFSFLVGRSTNGSDQVQEELALVYHLDLEQGCSWATIAQARLKHELNWARYGLDSGLISGPIFSFTDL